MSARQIVQCISLPVQAKGNGDGPVSQAVGHRPPGD